MIYTLLCRCVSALQTIWQLWQHTNCFAEREGFPETSNDDNDLSTIKDCCNADGEGHAGDSRDIIIEESSVGKDGVVG